MKKIFLGALVTLFALANVSISNADLVLDFNGGTVTQSNGNVINYTVTVNNGTLTGDPATGVFDSDETNNNGMTNANFTIMFTQDVDFIVSATPTQRATPETIVVSGSRQTRASLMPRLSLMQPLVVTELLSSPSKGQMERLPLHRTLTLVASQ